MKKDVPIITGIITLCLIFSCFGADSTIFPADSIQDHIVDVGFSMIAFREGGIELFKRQATCRFIKIKPLE